MRVALTGSTGYLGSEVSRQLAAASVDVAPLSRGGDHRTRWAVSCSTIDGVIHLAAPTSAIDDRGLQVALETTRTLFDALPDRPILFVFAGTMALFKAPIGGVEIDETSSVWCEPDLERQDMYTRMKSAQEDLVRSLCRQRGDILTIVRPSNVWDETRWLQSCVGPKAGPFWIVIAPMRRLRVIHLQNCARAFVDALQLDGPDNCEFNVDDNADISAWRYATGIVDWRARGYLPVPVAGWLFDAVAMVAGNALRLIRPRHRLPGLLLKERREARFGSFGVDTRLARRLIGWMPDLRPYRSGR